MCSIHCTELVRFPAGINGTGLSVTSSSPGTFTTSGSLYCSILTKRRLTEFQQVKRHSTRRLNRPTWYRVIFSERTTTTQLLDVGVTGKENIFFETKSAIILSNCDLSPPRRFERLQKIEQPSVSLEFFFKRKPLFTKNNIFRVLFFAKGEVFQNSLELDKFELCEGCKLLRLSNSVLLSQ